MKIATWNVNGIRARQSQLVEWARRELPDVLCLQEIKASADQIDEALTMLPEYWSWWHGGPKGYSGVSLHVRKDAFAGRPECSPPPFDVENRAIEARLTGGLSVASVYVPNGGKDYGAKMRFLEGMRDWVRAELAAGRRLVVCGDLNVARTDADVTPSDRNARSIGQRRDERAVFEGILEAGLVDVARALHPDTDSMFTWWPPWRNLRQKNQGWRIDYVLASAPPGLRPVDCRVLPEIGTSDHAPVVATFE